jgi:hypothetical protein
MKEEKASKAEEDGEGARGSKETEDGRSEISCVSEGG